MASLAMNHILERIALFQFTPTHCVQARAMLGWSVEQLSRKAEVAVDDIQRFPWSAFGPTFLFGSGGLCLCRH